VIFPVRREFKSIGGRKVGVKEKIRLKKGGIGHPQIRHRP